MYAAQQNPESAGGISHACIAVLAILLEKPSPTSEINRRFEERYGRLLGVGYGRVRQALREGRRKGLVEFLPAVDADDLAETGGRTRYRVTAAGARAYREWIGDIAPDGQGIRQRILAAHSQAEMLAIVATHEQAYRDALARLHRPNESDLAIDLVLDRDREDLRAGLRWAEMARARIERSRQ